MKKDKKLYNKSNTICIRINEEELQELEYLRIKLHLRDYSKTIRKLINDGFTKH